jgi:uncharacterized repeat protein (TIGR01451 family)
MRKLYLMLSIVALGLGGLFLVPLGTAQPMPQVPKIPELPATPSKPVDASSLRIPGNDAPPLQLPNKFPDLPDLPKDTPTALPKEVRSPVLPPTNSLTLPSIPSAPSSPMKAPLGTTKTTAAPAEPLIAPGISSKPIVDSPLSVKQDSGVTLEWSGAGSVRVGRPSEYTLMVRNNCTTPVQRVVVQVRVPAKVKVVATEPKPSGPDGALYWEVGSLNAGESKPLKMSFVSASSSDMECNAWVTFTGTSSMKVPVREPKLVVESGPVQPVLVGDVARVSFVVSNPGDSPTEAIKVALKSGTGLELAQAKGLSLDLPPLAPGEKKVVRLPMLAKSTGSFPCEINFDAGHGLTKSESVTVSVVEPKLALAFEGPKNRYLGRKAAYSLKVSNSGDASATNVVVSQIIPAGFQFIASEPRAEFDPTGRTVKWAVGEVLPGEAKEVKLELMPTTAGDHAHIAVASGAHGLKAEKMVSTKVEGIAALLMEVVDVDDPVEVKGQTAYEIRITNTGSSYENDIQLVCSIPPQMKFKSAEGPVKYEVINNEVVFEKLPKLASRADTTFKVIVTAVKKGDARFKATLTSKGLTEPVLKQESTRIYED